MTSATATPNPQQPYQGLQGIHLALGGGSARGLAHLGILKALKESQIPIASVAGTSMGALVGASFALLGDADEVVQHFKEHVRSEQFNHTRYNFLKQITRRNREDRGFNFSRGLKKGYLLSQSYTKGSIISYDEYTREIFALIPDKSFKATKYPFLATSVDLMQTREVVFNKGYLRSAVMASAAIPGLFPAIVSGETLYIDGGWMNKIPVTPLLHQGARNILAVNVSDNEVPDLNPKRGTHLMRMADMASQVRLQELQLKHAPCLWDVDVSSLDLMDFDQVDKAMEIGYQHAMSSMGSVKRMLETPAAKQSLRKRICRLLCPKESQTQPMHFDLDIRGIWDVTSIENTTQSTFS